MAPLRRAILLPLLALLALGLVACGDEPEGADSTATPGTQAPGTAAPGGGDVPATPPADAFRVASPDSLTSYRYEIEVKILPEALDQGAAPAGLNLEGIEFVITGSGEVVNPDRERSKIVANLGFASLDIETITVGEDQWTRQPNGSWVRGSAVAGGGGVLGGADFSPSNIFPSATDFSFEDLSARLETVDFERVEVNGVTARHYVLTEAQFVELFHTEDSIIPDTVADTEMTAEVWFDEASGVPVRLLVVAVNAEGKEVLRLTLDLTDLDDPGIAVEPPT